MSFNTQTATVGTCVFCRENELVVPWPSSDGGLGVCDLCSYALRHTWQKLRGELVAATSPALVRTYALVPKLRSKRSEADVSGYEFLVDEVGCLPYAEWLKTDNDLCAWLGKSFGVKAWPETARPCYLGYAGSADFSEVKLVWSWGKDFRGGHRLKFASFAELLATPTPDAGFHLGVKAAFEAILWRRELAPEGNQPCVFLREPAMRYLLSLEAEPGEGGEEDDVAMVEVCRQAMTAEEQEVAEILEDARDKRREAAKLEEERQAAEKTKDEKKDDDGFEEGFARRAGTIVSPEDKS